MRIEDQLRDGATPPGAPLDVTPVLGTWFATDENAVGIVKLVLGRANGLFVVRAFGAARPEPLDWGESEATAYGSSVTATKAMAFSAHFDFGFLVTDLAAYVKQGILVLDTFNTFTDSSGRANYFSREFFHR
jgi:hypothetical protein